MKVRRYIAVDDVALEVLDVPLRRHQTCLRARAVCSYRGIHRCDEACHSGLATGIVPAEVAALLLLRCEALVAKAPFYKDIA